MLRFTFILAYCRLRLTENEISCLGSQSSYQNLWDQNVRPPHSCQELFRVIGVLGTTMKRFLIIWEVVCVRPSVCTCTSICVKDVYPSASNVGLRTRKENCLEWRPGSELDGFYFTPTNLWK